MNRGWRFGILFTTAFVLIITNIRHTAAQTPQSGRDEWLYAKRLYDEGFYDLAAEQLERYIRDYPQQVDIVEAQFLLGEAYQRFNQLEKCRSAFLKVALLFPDSPRAPEALFKVGEVLETLGRYDDAAQSYLRIHGFYPDHPHAASGMSRAGTLYKNIGDSARAETIFEQLLDLYGRSEAANIARIELGRLNRSRADNFRARAFFERALSSSSDSLLAVANLELARLARSEWLLHLATEHYKSAIKSLPNSGFAAQVRLELGDLLNFRGLTGEALTTLEPLISRQDSAVIIQALIKIGDAYYREKKFTNALQYYNRCARQSSEAALKAAWTAEKNQSPDQSLKRYLEVIKRDPKHSGYANLRAAILAMELGEVELSADLWASAARDSALADYTDRILMELGRALFEAGRGGVDSLARRLRLRHASSPYQDDLTYTAGLAAERSGDYPAAVSAFEAVMTLFPASPYADSAKFSIDFIRENLMQGDRLIEKMAGLSANLAGVSNPTRWALAWGDFWLNEFRDPVKAVDHYDKVLDDIVATTPDRLTALKGTFTAYLRLATLSHRESDPFAAAMFADSAYSRWSQIAALAPGDSATLALWGKLFLLEIQRVGDDHVELKKLLSTARNHFQRYGEGRFQPEVSASFVHARIALGSLDSLENAFLWKVNQNILANTDDERVRAAARYQIIRLLAESGRLVAALDSAKKLADEQPNTPSGAEAAWWVIESTRVNTADRLSRLTAYKKRYPYLVNPVVVYNLEAELLSALGEPLAALEAREKAQSELTWGTPELDILEVPDVTAFYRRGIAFLHAGQLRRAALEFRSLLNVDPMNDPAPDAMVNLAHLRTAERDYSTALAYLDTLKSRFPTSPAQGLGVRLLPRILMASENYAQARQAYLTIYDREKNPDSAFVYLTQAIVCLYRLNRLDEAREEAHELYSRFKENRDIENVKALFYLEKGLALDKAKNFEEAQKQYRIVIDRFSFSPWSAHSAYQLALSQVQQGKLEEGVKGLSSFCDNYPDHPLTHRARISLGSAQYRREKYTDAIAAFNYVWEDKQAGERWEEAFEGLLVVYRDLRYWDAAIRLTRDYLDRFPGTEKALDRRMDIAQYYMQLGEWKEAIRHYRPLLPVADTESEAEIQYYIGEAYMNLGDYRSAILEFLKVDVLGLKTKLDWGVTAIYNAGLCYEKLNDFEGAGRMYKRIIQISGAESNYGRAAQQRLDGLKAGR